MTGYCALADHTNCPDASADTYACSCPCHLSQDDTRSRAVILFDHLARVHGTIAAAIDGIPAEEQHRFAHDDERMAMRALAILADDEREAQS